MTNMIINNNVIDSREVAIMLGRQHSDIMKMINGSGKNLGILPVLLKGNFPLSEYFIESSYKDASGRDNKCYLITKMGCEILGSKQQGEKGIMFSIKYVERFNQMEEELRMQQMIKQFSLPTNYREALSSLIEMDKKNEELRNTINIQAPKVKAYDDFMESNDLYSVNEIAKVLCIPKMGRNNLHKWLRGNKILQEDSYEAYQKHIELGHVIHRRRNYAIGNSNKAEIVALFTPKGVDFLYKTLRSQNHLTRKSMEAIARELEAESNVLEIEE